jgi:hypothetical protein
MNRELQECSRTIAEVNRALAQPPPVNLNAESYRHLSMCPRCRAGLLLMLHGLAPGRAGQDKGCDACQADLAAFIDREQHDPALAASLYPHVWWHLWICDVCAQTYDLTHTLLDAQRSGALAPLRVPAHGTRHTPAILHRLSLPRHTLSHIFPVIQGSMAAQRGAASERYVLYDDVDDEGEERQFTLLVQNQSAATWQLIAIVRPPPSALLVLTIGEHRFAAVFRPDGQAAIGDVPSDLLAARDAPDLDISVVPLAEADATSASQSAGRHTAG